jgi:ketosteroid isomerase-like protein
MEGVMRDDSPAGTGPETIVRAFVDAINRQDIGGIVKLCSADHEFVDACGNVVRAPEIAAAWRGYFGFMPRYGIETEDIFCAGDLVAVFGHAWGSLDATEEGSRRWRRPAAWRARVSERRISLWQVYADTKIVFDLLTPKE